MKYSNYKNVDIVPTLGRHVAPRVVGPVLPVKHIEPPSTTEIANPATIAVIMLRRHKELFSGKEDADSKFLVKTAFNAHKRPMDFTVARRVIRLLKERKKVVE